MKNEPYCWLLNHELWFKEPKETDKEFEGYEITPLYTHPVKELDRELLDKVIIDQQNEIKDLRKNLDVALMIVNKPELTDEEIIKLYEDMLGVASARGSAIDFARAILRKAQEK